MNIAGNFHTHTTFCDGNNTAEEMVREALTLRFDTIGFTGHVDPPQGVALDVSAYLAEIRRLQEAYRGQIDILRGAELDNVLSPDCAGDTEYRIGSTHFVPAPGHAARDHALSRAEAEAEQARLICVDYRVTDLYADCKQFYDGDFYALAADYFRFESGVVSRTLPAFIGHFDLITRFNDLPAEEGGAFLDETDVRYLSPARDAMERIVRDGMRYFEVNCGATNRGRKKEPYPCAALLRTLRELDGEVVLNADAHDRALLAGGFAEALDLVAACGFDHVNVLTREETDVPANNTVQDVRFTDGRERVPLFWKRTALSGLHG